MLPGHLQRGAGEGRQNRGLHLWMQEPRLSSPGPQAVPAGDEPGVALLVGEGVAGAAVEGVTGDVGAQLHRGLRRPLGLQADLLQGDEEMRAVATSQANPHPKGGRAGTPSTKTRFGSQLHCDLSCHEGMCTIGTLPGSSKLLELWSTVSTPALIWELFVPPEGYKPMTHMGMSSMKAGGGTKTCSRLQSLLIGKSRKPVPDLGTSGMRSHHQVSGATKER